MKTAVAVIFAFSTLGASYHLSAADGNADRLQKDTPAKRISSIKWDTQTGKLEWVVQSGVERNGQFVPSSQEERYEITPEQAMMAFQGQQRGFTTQEADWLQQLLHVLTVYCAESTVWWAEGQGTPLDSHGKPLEHSQPPADKPAKSDSSDTAPHKVQYSPERKVPGAVQLIAQRMIQ
ncbi:MAG TPA: hypothetical protein VH640_01790 [Bryobacteraceae bacterium]|jgi:hypothetical protein